MGLSKSEQETYISFSADDKKAMIFSTDPVWIRKVRKLCDEHPDNYQIKESGKLNGEEISITVICQDKSLVSLRSEKRKMTDEQKAAYAARLIGKSNSDSAQCSGERMG